MVKGRGQGQIAGAGGSPVDVRHLDHRERSPEHEHKAPSRSCEVTQQMSGPSKPALSLSKCRSPAEPMHDSLIMAGFPPAKEGQTVEKRSLFNRQGGNRPAHAPKPQSRQAPNSRNIEGQTEKSEAFFSRGGAQRSPNHSRTHDLRLQVKTPAAPDAPNQAY